MSENIQNQIGSILKLSEAISHQVGRGGKIDPPEAAYKKLFEGDPSKKKNDLGEAEEIIEELNKLPIDKPGLSSEIADFMYYAAKIPNLPYAKIESFLGHCGFSIRGAVRAAEVKYEARVHMNEIGGDREAKHKYENEKLATWLTAAEETGLVDFSKLDKEFAKDELAALKKEIYDINFKSSI